MIKKGTIILNAGDSSETIDIIVKGSIKARLSSKAHCSESELTLCSGTVFSELSLMARSGQLNYLCKSNSTCKYYII